MGITKKRGVIKGLRKNAAKAEEGLGVQRPVSGRVTGGRAVQGPLGVCEGFQQGREKMGFAS